MFLSQGLIICNELCWNLIDLNEKAKLFFNANVFVCKALPRVHIGHCVLCVIHYDICMTRIFFMVIMVILWILWPLYDQYGFVWPLFVSSMVA